jgi:hypothetical protein
LKTKHSQCRHFLAVSALDHTNLHPVLFDGHLVSVVVPQNILQNFPQVKAFP